jgi:CarD family transcriptional regulator
MRSRLLSAYPIYVSLPLRRKRTADTYREALACANCEQYVSIIKTVYARREEAIKQKKRLAESDNDYEKKAKFCLFGELSVAMGISVSEVERLVEDKICGVAV